MKIIRTVVNNWVATDWVEASADLSGTGTDVAVSSYMQISLPDVSMVDWCLEVERTVQRTGGTGVAVSTIKIAGFQGDVTSTDGADAASFYAGQVKGNDTARMKRSLFRSSVLQPSTYEGLSALGVYVRGNGSAADTQWAVTGIRCRLLYVPFGA